VSSCYGFIEAEKTSFPSSLCAACLGFRGAANTRVVNGLREVGMTLSMGDRDRLGQRDGRSRLSQN
jgi:hypothetical protein